MLFRNRYAPAIATCRKTVHTLQKTLKKAEAHTLARSQPLTSANVKLLGGLDAVGVMLADPVRAQGTRLVRSAPWQRQPASQATRFCRLSTKSLSAAACSSLFCVATS